MIDREYPRPVRAGTIIMLVGLALVAIGALVRYAPGLFTWFGHLPGDLDIETENGRIFVPITSMIVVSLVLTGIVNLVGLFFRDR